MTVTPSRVGLVIDTLVALLKASPTFADPARVYDGPVTTGDTQWSQAVFVGFDGNFQGSWESALIDQTRPYLGVTTGEEILEIRCCAEAVSGDLTTKVVRDQALAMLAGVETVIRTDPRLGIDGSTNATLQVGTLYQIAYSDSLHVRIPFVIHVQTTITTA
jgi:hypothetical protein